MLVISVPYRYSLGFPNCLIVTAPHDLVFRGSDYVSYQGWKTERVVEEYHDGRIILVNQHDPKSHVKKVRYSAT